MRKILLCFVVGTMTVLLLTCGASLATVVANAPIVSNFSLSDHHGQFHALADYRDQKAIVIVVQGNGCPIVRKSFLYLNGLKKQFADRDIAFLLINSNSQDDRASIAQEAADFGVEWPILVDSEQVAALALQVSRTAEAFIIDPRTMTIVYRGPIHDKLGYEFEREAIGHEYLKDQLTAFLDGQPLAVVTAPVKGCLVLMPKPSGIR